MEYARGRQQNPAPYYWLLIGSGLAAAAGYFGPWVPHRAAGLVITGLDLAEYAKFVPQVASGQIPLRRELFYLPLFVLSISAALLGGRRLLPAWVRLVLALGAIPLALAMLPPAWKPADLLTPEYRIQATAIAVCLAMVPGIVITRFLPDRIVLGLIALLGLAAGAWPAWAFLEMRPAIEAIYRDVLPLGWGFWAATLGCVTLSVTAIAEAVRGR